MSAQDTGVVVPDPDTDGIIASPFSKDSHPEGPKLDYKKYRMELRKEVQDKLAFVSRKASTWKGKLA